MELLWKESTKGSKGGFDFFFSFEFFLNHIPQEDTNIVQYVFTFLFKYQGGMIDFCGTDKIYMYK